MKLTSKDSSEQSTFNLEICSFLKELPCPYKLLTVGIIDERYKSYQNKLDLLDFLTSELQAAKIISINKPEITPTITTSDAKVSTSSAGSSGTGSAGTNKKNQSIEQNYPVGHPLHKLEVKISEYKINSKLEIEHNSVYAIKVTNLPEDVDINELWEMFEYYGRIENNGIRVKKFYNDTVAFVNYLNIESATKAIEKCNKKRIGFCIIGVEMTQNK